MELLRPAPQKCPFRSRAARRIPNVPGAPRAAEVPARISGAGRAGNVHHPPTTTHQLPATNPQPLQTLAQMHVGRIGEEEDEALPENARQKY